MVHRELDHDRVHRHSVHGGEGYVEETGAAQYLRDARITTIYEGTTGIQANDLIGRKLARDKGVNAAALIRDMKAELEALAPTNDTDLALIRSALTIALTGVRGGDGLDAGALR